MSDNTAIEVKDVRIRYRSFMKMSIRKNLFSLRKNDVEYFEAIRGVSFNVQKGKILGIVGKNGSGKSTLLRAIAKIYSPDEGTIDLHGNSVALMALGVGFERKLTGRENIVLSGMLLGFSEEEINEKIEDIIEFAGLGDFIDRPVSTYSSGMHSKLAFSITANLETDIMLIDEVLSVGDIKFKKKSRAKMMELIKTEGRTVVMVSHDTNTMLDLCNDMIWLDDGVIRMQGDPQEVMAAYQEFMQ